MSGGTKIRNSELVIRHQAFFHTFTQTVKKLGCDFLVSKLEIKTL
jgi:hypothetical protein